MSFEAADKDLAHVFCEDYLFSVPGYQRPYSWEKEHAQALFDDILDFMRSTPTAKRNELPAYFLGSILLIKKSGEPEADIVDGQQRLTTLTILLSAIRYLHDDPDVKNGLTGTIHQKEDKVRGIKDVFRLKLRDCDQEFFNKYIQEEGGFKKLLEFNGQLKDSKKNIRDNAKLFENNLSKLSKEEKSQLAQFIIKRCYLIVVTTPDVDSAYRIFSVLNSRGLDLSVADILKSKVLGKIHETKRDEYTEKWENMEGQLSRDSFSDLIGYIRMIFRKSKSQETLLKEFGDYFEKYVNGDSKGNAPQGDAIDFINNILLPAHEAYSEITLSDFDTNDLKLKKAVNDYLRCLNRLDFNHWIPPAIRFLIENKNNAQSVCEFFRKMEILAYSMVLTKSTQNERIERLSRVTQFIDDQKDLIRENDSPLNLTREERKRTHEILKEAPIYEYLSAKNRTALLLRLNSIFDSAGEIGYDQKTISVEHVLPQKPKAKSQWLIWFNKRQRENILHKLGNLALLTRNKNSQASNYDFDAKKEKYFSSQGGISTFALTVQILQCDEWTFSVFESRHADLVNRLASHWELNKH